MARDKAYRKAEAKIEKALRNGATELDLSEMGLAEVPESLGQLTQLQELYLFSNQLSSLPESLGQLTQLQTLYLHSNQLSSLPESLGQLIQLQTLSLGSNQLSPLPESLGQLTKLRVLYLQNNQLSSLPATLDRLTQLRSLNLNSNRLSLVPEVLGRLTQLRRLDLHDNQLTALPEVLGRLTQLHTLNFGNVGLSSLPEVLGRLTQLHTLGLHYNRLSSVPEWLGELTQLRELDLHYNQLTSLPEVLGRLIQLRALDLHGNQLSSLPEALGRLTQLRELDLHDNQLSSLPASLDRLTRLHHLNLNSNRLSLVPEVLGRLAKLQSLGLGHNQLSSLPASLGQLTNLQVLYLGRNPLDPELAAAYGQGIPSVLAYLRAKAEKSIVLNEAKLVLVGEGEVGKSCLLGALRGDDWEGNRPTTHGIEIKPVTVTNPDTGTPITLNGWDFGGQPVYRPTHQLFFSAPAVYLVVWKPREGVQAGQVKEWIKLVKHRAPEARVIVVATHGGPQERQPDIDRQELWDLFGKETVVDFFHVDSLPPEEDQKSNKRTGTGKNIAALRDAIARVAGKLPEVGRTVPATWQKARETFHQSKKPYLSLTEVRETCRKCGMDADGADLFLSVSHQLGHLIHYEHDAVLRDIVVLKPDWLATAISFVLDDPETRETNAGVVTAARLARLWDDPARKPEFRYKADCHPIFRKLMERYDLAYPVPDVADAHLIGQLVPDVRPAEKLARAWPQGDGPGATPEQVQVCKVLDSGNRSASAEGLLYQLLVRLHKFSLGRKIFADSVHWQRGLVLEDAYGSRALLEHVENDIRITVRAPYPERFLSALTYEVKHLVESFWKDLRCSVTVPCLNPRGLRPRCTGLFEVAQLIENTSAGHPQQPCGLCNGWQKIDELLRNAPAAQPDPLAALIVGDLGDVKAAVAALSAAGEQRQAELIGRFDQADAAADARDKGQALRVEAAYDRLIRALVDEAKEGPRLFHMEPVNPKFFSLRGWVSEKFRITLWCEHARLPLPVLNFQLGTPDEKAGVYEVTVPRAWFATAAPYLKGVGTVLGLVVPLAAPLMQLTLDKDVYAKLEKQLASGQKAVESVLKGTEKAVDWMGKDDAPDLDRGGSSAGAPVRAAGAVLRQLHAWLKEKDAGFGGLIRVQNRRGEYLWVHPKYETEY